MLFSSEKKVHKILAISTLCSKVLAALGMMIHVHIVMSITHAPFTGLQKTEKWGDSGQLWLNEFPSSVLFSTDVYQVYLASDSWILYWYRLQCVVYPHLC